MTHEEFLEKQNKMLVDSINEVNQKQAETSLRDYFAASALQGLLACHETGCLTDFVESAYEYADEMLKVRQRERGE